MKSEELLDAKIRFSITLSVTFSKFPLPRNEGAGRRGGTRAGVTARRRERRRNIGGAKSPRRFFVCRRVSLPAMPAPSLTSLPPSYLQTMSFPLPRRSLSAPAPIRPDAPRPMPAATFPLPHFEISVILPSPLSPGPAQLTINSDLGNTELLQEQRTLLFS